MISALGGMGSLGGQSDPRPAFCSCAFEPAESLAWVVFGSFVGRDLIGIRLAAYASGTGSATIRLYAAGVYVVGSEIIISAPGPDTLFFCHAYFNVRANKLYQIAVQHPEELPVVIRTAFLVDSTLMRNLLARHALP
jgi:hypothetical protein